MACVSTGLLLWDYPTCLDFLFYLLPCLCFPHYFWTTITFPCHTMPAFCPYPLYLPALCLPCCSRPSPALPSAFLSLYYKDRDRDRDRTEEDEKKEEEGLRKADWRWDTAATVVPTVPALALHLPASYPSHFAFFWRDLWISSASHPLTISLSFSSSISSPLLSSHPSQKQSIVPYLSLAFTKISLSGMQVYLLCILWFETDRQHLHRTSGVVRLGDGVEGEGEAGGGRGRQGEERKKPCTVAAGNLFGSWWRDACVAGRSMTGSWFVVGFGNTIVTGNDVRPLWRNARNMPDVCVCNGQWLVTLEAGLGLGAFQGNSKTGSSGSELFSFSCSPPVFFPSLPCKQIIHGLCHTTCHHCHLPLSWMSLYVRLLSLSSLYKTHTCLSSLVMVTCIIILHVYLYMERRHTTLPQAVLEGGQDQGDRIGWGTGRQEGACNTGRQEQGEGGLK